MDRIDVWCNYSIFMIGYLCALFLSEWDNNFVNLSTPDPINIFHGVAVFIMQMWIVLSAVIMILVLKDYIREARKNES